MLNTIFKESVFKPEDCRFYMKRWVYVDETHEKLEDFCTNPKNRKNLCIPSKCPIFYRSTEIIISYNITEYTIRGVK